jgi:hypothetical protein
MSIIFTWKVALSFYIGKFEYGVLEGDFNETLGYISFTLRGRWDDITIIQMVRIFTNNILVELANFF